MARFEVTIVEKTLITRAKTFEAASKQEAEDLASKEDWSTWEEGFNAEDHYIDSVIQVDDEEELT